MNGRPHVDLEMIEVFASTSEGFVKKVNALLRVGIYRIAHVEIAVSNNLYLAILIRCR